MKISINYSVVYRNYNVISTNNTVVYKNTIDIHRK